ncbi:flavodoxin [Paenibacillus glycanilyticus]|uniref:Flavodoxin n=1 Tax=Paenibacillus glycanilyticus TaxID=126569 RepID=A0ABQ6GDS0_9BACL|nr:flavodoxin [Paenibacillus glycanilyticus]GLX67436.1 flavodoxin [Paenibacillus glycanilyticus]
MKVIVAYASLTGNTEEMAEAIAAGAREAGAEVAVRDAYDADASELDQYDGIAVGAYTWGDGELPDEFIDFYEALDHLDLSGRKAIVFGSGDSSYPIFCGAVDTIEQKLKELGAELVAPGVKVEFDPSKDEIGQCRLVGRLIAGDVVTAAS